MGLIEDNAYTTSQFFQKSGDVLFLLGETKENWEAAPISKCKQGKSAECLGTGLGKGAAAAAGGSGKHPPGAMLFPRMIFHMEDFLWHC